MTGGDNLLWALVSSSGQAVCRLCATHTELLRRGTMAWHTCHYVSFTHILCTYVLSTMEHANTQ